MQVDQYKIPIERWQFEEILEKRLSEGIRIENLFGVYPAPKADKEVPGDFLDTHVETKFGKLRFFLVPDCPLDKAYVLHRERFPYPRKRNHDHFDKNGDLVR